MQLFMAAAVHSSFWTRKSVEAALPLSVRRLEITKISNFIFIYFYFISIFLSPAYPPPERHDVVGGPADDEARHQDPGHSDGLDLGLRDEAQLSLGTTWGQSMARIRPVPGWMSVEIKRYQLKLRDSQTPFGWVEMYLNSRLYNSCQTECKITRYILMTSQFPDRLLSMHN